MKISTNALSSIPPQLGQFSTTASVGNASVGTNKPAPPLAGALILTIQNNEFFEFTLISVYLTPNNIHIMFSHKQTWQLKYSAGSTA